PAATAHLEAITRVVSDAISEVRSLVHNLRPVHIEQLGLTDSLEGLLNEMKEAASLRIEHRLENVDDLFRGEDATHIFRIVQEALNNLTKHARATRAEVSLERDLHCV